MVLKPAGLATGKADIHAELWRKTHPVWTGKLSVRRRKRARSAKRKGFLEKRRYKPYPSSHKMDNPCGVLHRVFNMSLSLVPVEQDSGPRGPQGLQGLQTAGSGPWSVHTWIPSSSPTSPG
ncbi:unnamed protein product [Pleuronectes platessa]|uniref:Uncharacterized protein n=1 Tax=Pleuronectes platessa TaxID=8262 RepID=A0A9N7UHD2_PLEPL|nr:unnamed protein product [Pleuronectes platessa]